MFQIASIEDAEYFIKNFEDFCRKQAEKNNISFDEFKSAKGTYSLPTPTHLCHLPDGQEQLNSAITSTEYLKSLTLERDGKTSQKQQSWTPSTL